MYKYKVLLEETSVFVRRQIIVSPRSCVTAPSRKRMKLINAYKVVKFDTYFLLACPLTAIHVTNGQFFHFKNCGR
jgi:hypothetical protein